MALYACKVDLYPARGDEAEVRGVDMQHGEVMLRLEWADVVVGRDAFTDHGVSAVVLWGSVFCLSWGFNWVRVHEEEGTLTHPQ